MVSTEAGFSMRPFTRPQRLTPCNVSLRRSRCSWPTSSNPSRTFPRPVRFWAPLLDAFRAPGTIIARTRCRFRAGTLLPTPNRRSPSGISRPLRIVALGPVSATEAHRNIRPDLSSLPTGSAFYRSHRRIIVPSPLRSFQLAVPSAPNYEIDDTQNIPFILKWMQKVRSRVQE